MNQFNERRDCGCPTTRLNNRVFEKEFEYE
jgi:hypothetical protein